MENSLEQRIKNIEERNARVEADKAWETSWARALFIAFTTYLLIMVFMLLINDDHPYLNALIASVGYLLSTTTYGFLKKWWLKRNAK